MKQLFPFYFLLVFLFWQCGQSGSQQETAAEVPPAISEDDLITRLSLDFIADPQTQAEQEQNTMLNYAIDQLLDVQRLDNGLYYHIENIGTGKDSIAWGDLLTVDYTGQFLNGKIFDSSIERGKALTFRVGNMIQGWNSGLQLLRAGGKATFLIPSALGYGEEGLGEEGEKIVPPNEILRFDVEVLDVKKMN